jgi:hypothetical protein
LKFLLKFDRQYGSFFYHQNPAAAATTTTSPALGVSDVVCPFQSILCGSLESAASRSRWDVTTDDDDDDDDNDDDVFNQILYIFSSSSWCNFLWSNDQTETQTTYFELNHHHTTGRNRTSKREEL